MIIKPKIIELRPLDARTLGVRRTLSAAVAMAMLAGFAPSTLADGALYVALPKKGLRDGFAYGFAYSRPAAEDAKSVARKVCEAQALTVNIRVGACQLIETFKKRCVSVAMDSTDKWAGWSTGATKEEADALAVAECAKGAGACVVQESACDE